jgi:hypothetical protein
MLGGAPPFNAGSYVALVQLHVSAAVPPLAARRPDLPRELVRAVHRALEKDPGKRFADAMEFARALPSAESLKESFSGGTTTREAANPRRRRWWPVLLASAVVGAGAVTGAVLLQKKDTGRGEQRTGDRGQGIEEKVPPPPAPVVEQVVEASLEIDSAPRGAQVFVDGVNQGKTPLRLQSVAVGTHVLRVEARGYEEVETEKAVRPGYAETFFAVLAKRGSGHQATVTKSGRDKAGKRQPEPKHAEPKRDEDGTGKPNPYLDQ